MATLAQPLPTTHDPQPVAHEGLRLVLRMPPGARLDDEQLLEFMYLNRDYVIEQSADGEIIVMSPPAGETGYRESSIVAQLWNWSERDGTGVSLGTDTMFKLPSGATHGPDAAWVLRSRLAKLTREQKRKILPLAPDFAIELMSPSDRLAAAKRKMQMWIDNGVRLAWLIDPDRRTVHIYSPEGVKKLENPNEVSGDPILPGFTLDLERIWTPGW